MQETKDPKSNEGGTPQSKDSEATSSETLSEIEEQEKVSDEKNEGGRASSTPSPDGAFDAERGGRNDAGPM